MNKTNKLAILLATYNGEKFVDEQIDSLLKQTYQDWELFIHDDGSKDNTGSVIKQYSEKYPEKIDRDSAYRDQSCLECRCINGPC